MPKQQIAINKFEGGLHTDADPRDIADNEFSSLQGFSVDSLGIIKLMGASAAYSSIDANTAPSSTGYGIFQFSSDYSDGGAIVSTNYLVLGDGTYIDIYDDVGDAWNGMVNIDSTNGFALGETSTSATDVKHSFYAPFGILRVCDGNFSNTSNVPKWLGFIPKKNYGKGTHTTYPTTFADVEVGDGAVVKFTDITCDYDDDPTITMDSTAKVVAGMEVIGEGIPANATVSSVSGDGTTFELSTSTVGGAFNNSALAFGITQDGWVVADASVETGITSSNLKMINVGSKTKGQLEGDATGTAIITTVSGNAVTIAHAGIDHGVEKADDVFNGMTCSFWKSGVGAKYGVVYDYNYAFDVYDSGTQTTHSTFYIHMGPNGDGTPQGEGIDATYSFQVGQSDAALWNLQLHQVSKGRGVISADWGVTLIFDEGTAGEGTWMTDTNTRYKFFSTTIFDEVQESNPAVFTMYPTKQAAGQTSHATVSEMYFRDGASEIGTDSDDGGTSNADSIGTPSMQVPVTFGLIVRMKSDNAPDGTAAGKNFIIGDADYDITDQDAVDEEGLYNFLDSNQRVTGGRIYWASNEDGYSTLYALMEYSLEKGARTFGASVTGGTGGYAPWRSWVYPVASNPVVVPDFTDGETTFYDPPIVETYETLNFFPHDVRLNAKWKTAVVANNRTYIANIKRQANSTFDGGGSWSATETDDAVNADTIVKSPPGRYDIFPDVPIGPGGGFEFTAGTSNDGDEIVKLEAFSDRLLVFKKNSLAIINIQKENEILEGEYKYIGLDGGHPAQACLTDIGVAWINSNGLYLFDGETVKPLVDNKIRNMWVGEDEFTGSAFWKSDTDDIPMIGYDPASKKIICLKTASAGGSDLEDILVYSFKTKSWSYKKNAFDDNTKKRMIVYKGELIYDNGSQIQKWSDTPAVGAGSGTNIIHTKDYDFGAPGVRKKIHKVYVTYQSGGSATNVQVKYGADGTTTLDKTFKDGTNFTSNELDAATGWQVAELKPSTSSEANNKYSFRLAFTTDGAIPAAFEINDITIVYRVKPIK